MGLARGLTMLNTRKRKVKLTKAKIAELETRWRKNNKHMKSMGLHAMRYEKFEDYVDYCYGKRTTKDFKIVRSPLTPVETPRMKASREHREKYPSLPMGHAINGKGTKDDRWESEKKTISSGYTVAPAYNKGAYQVIGKSNIKDIGR